MTDEEKRQIVTNKIAEHAGFLVWFILYTVQADEGSIRLDNLKHAGKNLGNYELSIKRIDDGGK